VIGQPGAVKVYTRGWHREQRRVEGSEMPTLEPRLSWTLRVITIMLSGKIKKGGYKDVGG